MHAVGPANVDGTTLQCQWGRKFQLLVDRTTQSFDYERDMPSYDEALAKAEHYYRRALQLRSEHGLALTQKPLALTLLYRRQRGVAVEKSELEMLLRNAMELADPSLDPQLRPSALAYLSVVDML